MNKITITGSDLRVVDGDDPADDYSAYYDDFFKGAKCCDQDFLSETEAIRRALRCVADREYPAAAAFLADAYATKERGE